jgi:hypothetical protein
MAASPEFINTKRAAALARRVDDFTQQIAEFEASRQGLRAM